MFPENKIKRVGELEKVINLIKETDKKKIGFTNGCFDLLHLGHLEYLSSARSDVDCLIVGLNSDTSVSKLKGKNRPINKENDRALFLSFLHFIDYVVIFNELTPLNLINRLQPNVLFKGGDYKESEISGSETIKLSGGKVIIKPFKSNFSSSSIINKIQNPI